MTRDDLKAANVRFLNQFANDVRYEDLLGIATVYKIENPEGYKAEDLVEVLAELWTENNSFLCDE